MIYSGSGSGALRGPDFALFFEVEVLNDSVYEQDESPWLFVAASILSGDIAHVSLLGTESSKYYRVTVYPHRYPELNSDSGLATQSLQIFNYHQFLAELFQFFDIRDLLPLVSQFLQSADQHASRLPAPPS